MKNKLFWIFVLFLLVLTACKPGQEQVVSTISSSSVSQEGLKATIGTADSFNENTRIEIYEGCKESDFNDGGRCEIEIEIEIEDYVGEPTLKYKEKHYVERIGFKTKNNFTYPQETRYVNTTEDNKTYYLHPYNITIAVNHPYIVPIYKVHYPHYLTINTYEYDYSEYNGRVCSHYLLMVSKKDGGGGFEYIPSDKLCDNNYPVVHSGWGCYDIIDLSTNEIVESKREGYCEI